MQRHAAPALRRIIGSCFLLLAGSASAQWVTETYPLKAGYNALWLSIDCSDRAVADLVPAAVEEIWQWNADASATHFDTQPLAPLQGDSQWRVWKRAGPPVDPTLATLTANAAYIVKVAVGTAPFNLPLKGKPVAPDYLLKSSGVNFLGFPTLPAAPPNFTNFLGFSEVLGNAPPIYRYDGEVEAIPRRVVAPNATPVVRGQAYWVQTTDYTDYYGPLQVTVLSSGGIDFGTRLNATTVRVRNVTKSSKNETVTATFTLANSESPPSGGGVPAPVQVLVRGPRDANLEFTYSAVSGYSVPLAPGEEKEIILNANRATLGTPGQTYASILRISDSLGHARIDLPVSAVGTSKDGVWVGAALLNGVNHVETISGAEFVAPLGTPDGAGAETTTDVTGTRTTAAGLTTLATTLTATFDSNGNALLLTAGLNPDDYTVTGPGGAPVFQPGADYLIVSTNRALVDNGGAGYTAAPTVTLTGGAGNGATATAILSAGVVNVAMGNPGVGYTSAPTVTIEGGGGSGAAGLAIIDAETGKVTDVTVTNGGSGYQSYPEVIFTGGGGSGATAAAMIVGSVGRVLITLQGSGYTAPPQLLFTRAAGDRTGSGADATVAVSGGLVLGFDSIHKEPGGAIGESARITASTTGPAPAGTPDGTVVSTVTSTSRLITLNGRSHLRTRRVHAGEGAAARSNFPVRLILHSPASGSPTLLQQGYLGSRDGRGYVGPAEAPVAALVKGPLTKLNDLGETVPVPPGNLGRVSSASFPRGSSWTGSGDFNTSASFTVTLGYDAETNPFLHTYHPDHDNWDDRYENILSEGGESHTVTREITLAFSSERPAGVSDLTWGVTTLGGTYTEVLSGLRAGEGITVSGPFILQQVSEATALTQP